MANYQTICWEIQHHFLIFQTREMLKKPSVTFLFVFIVIIVVMGFLNKKNNDQSELNNNDENNSSFIQYHVNDPEDFDENVEWYKYNLDLFGEQIAIEYTGYKFFQPTEIRVSSSMLKKLEVKNSREEITKAILSAAKETFEENAYCHLLEKKDRCFDKKCFCLPGQEYDWLRLNESIDFFHENWEWYEENDFSYLLAKSVNNEEAKDLDDLLAKVIENAKVIKIIENNNQVLDVFNENKINNAVLIHLDTHSDLCYEENPEDFQEKIEDYINTLVSKKLVNKVYWVLPDWTKNKEVNYVFWGDQNIDGFIQLSCYNIGPKVLELYIDQAGNIKFDKPDDISKYQQISFERILIDELPQIESNQNVYLDLDLDYLGNTGFDTIAEANFNPTEKELSNIIFKIFNVLDQKKIVPDYISLSRSPGYTPEEDIIFIEQLFTNYYQNE